MPNFNQLTMQRSLKIKDSKANASKILFLHKYLFHFIQNSMENGKLREVRFVHQRSKHLSQTFNKSCFLAGKNRHDLPLFTQGESFLHTRFSL